ncbi:DinB family protein [Dyadobacter frigoris]|uniref:DinB family protein n=1 Tax=Dyadobacter frigoris TaxID=2576211 RepID=A0A4U6CPD1_9BACT|nr:DinB family protein [Dyadobacter frigoris]TKT85475.1 DinB family protein [Dyadobacter frigoris]GLU56248.1 hypothetical protein Dfri01_57090 [Dyadobacter frigoris]
MTESFQDYKIRILGYIEGQNILDLQTAMPDKLESYVKRIPADILSVRPSLNKWSVREIVAHLADDELVGAYRIRLILSDPGTVIQAFDQDKWAQHGKYKSMQMESSLRLFRELRQWNLSLFECLNSEQWQYYGIHAERGKESIQDIATYYAGHDINHFKQIEGIYSF